MVAFEICILIFYLLDIIITSNKIVSLPEKTLNNLIWPSLSRSLDYVISWCPFQPESSCDINFLWYDKVHTKILIWSAAVKHMYIT